MKEEETEELRRVAQLLLDLAGKKSQSLDQEAFNLRMPDTTMSNSELAEVARSEIAARNIRVKFLPSDMFAEGGWNILLDLFVAEDEGHKVSITDACIASSLPPTTALRHIHLLVERGLVHRAKDRTDNRREHLFLSVFGRESIRATLAAMHEIGCRHRRSFSPVSQRSQ